MKVTFRALERGEKLLGLPALGGLFDRALTPDLDAAQIPNRALLAAAFKLGWLIEDSRRVRINWRDMATEELGSVYEGLLELVPVREDEGRTFSFAGGAEARGNARKVSGSYYTPDSLVQCLLDSALDPVLERAEAEGGAEAILELNVIDPACGSGHFLLGAARRMATRVAQLRNPDAPDYNAAMRDVVRNCIHGVDRNPMAIELAKVALWIESVEPGKPLGFLDANIQCGDSLLGVFDLKVLDEGIPDDAYKPLTGDDKDTAKYFTKRNKDEKQGQGTLDFIGGGGTLPPAKLAATMDDLRHLPEDSVSQIAEKRRRFAAWEADPKRYAAKVACDLYIAAFLLPKKGGVPANPNSVTVPTTSHLRTRLGGGQIHGLLEAAAVDAAEYARAFHWPLAFPEVMIGRNGFDVVIGNPPWEVMQLEQLEYFAARVPEVAILQGSARKKAVADLEISDPGLFAEYESEQRLSDSQREFTRVSGRFPLSARGKVNTYAVFTELFKLLSGKSGGFALIVPTGIATDANTSDLFSNLIKDHRLISLFDFENRKGIFPEVHRTYRFSLLACGVNRSNIRLAFFLGSVDELEKPDYVSELTQDDVKLINPNTGTLPVFRTRKDSEIVKSIYNLIPTFIQDNEEGGIVNPWSADFRQGLFDMFYDSAFFQTALQLETAGFARNGSNWEFPTGLDAPIRDVKVRDKDLIVDSRVYVPLYEAKMFSAYNHRYSDYLSRGDDRGHRVLPRLQIEELADPTREAEPYYWVPKTILDKRCKNNSFLIGYGEATTATTERTCIVNAIPFAGIGHKEILIFSDKTPEEKLALIANCNSLVLDFVCRTKVSYINFGRFIFKQLPILPPSSYKESEISFIVPRVVELSYTSNSMTPFARELGFNGPPFAWDENRRAQLRAELDAWYALAYGLSRNELRYVLDPKDVMGTGYPSETFRVLQKNEIAKYGEYRTQRLTLAAYDALIVCGIQPRRERYPDF